MRITYKMLKDLEPCSDRWNNFTEHYPNYSGNLEDFIALEAITYRDKYWVLEALFIHFLQEFDTASSLEIDKTLSRLLDASPEC